MLTKGTKSSNKHKARYDDEGVELTDVHAAQRLQDLEEYVASLSVLDAPQMT